MFSSFRLPWIKLHAILILALQQNYFFFFYLLSHKIWFWLPLKGLSLLQPLIQTWQSICLPFCKTCSSEQRNSDTLPTDQPAWQNEYRLSGLFVLKPAIMFHHQNLIACEAKMFVEPFLSHLHHQDYVEESEHAIKVKLDKTQTTSLIETQTVLQSCNVCWFARSGWNSQTSEMFSFQSHKNQDLLTFTYYPIRDSQAFGHGLADSTQMWSYLWLPDQTSNLLKRKQ